MPSLNKKPQASTCVSGSCMTKAAAKPLPPLAARTAYPKAHIRLFLLFPGPAAADVSLNFLWYSSDRFSESSTSDCSASSFPLAHGNCRSLERKSQFNPVNKTDGSGRHIPCSPDLGFSECQSTAIQCKQHSYSACSPKALRETKIPPNYPQNS